MPTVEQIPQTVLAQLKQYAPMLLQIPGFNNWLTQGKIELSGGKKVAYGPNALADRAGALRHYSQFMDNVARQRHTDPMTRKTLSQQIALAYRIAKIRGLSDSSAKAAANSISLPNMFAWLVMSQTGAYRMPALLHNFERKAGVRSPYFGGGPTVVAQNARIGSFANHTFSKIANLSNAEHLRGLSLSEAGGLLTDQYMQGSFSDIMTDPYTFNRAGALTVKGKAAIDQRLSQVFSVGSDIRSLFGQEGESAQVAMNRFTEIMGTDPVQALGADTAAAVLGKLRHSADMSGVSPHETAMLMASMRQRTARSGVNLSKVISLTDYGMRMLASERGKTNMRSPLLTEDIINTMAEADTSHHARVWKAGFGALSMHRGRNKAWEITQNLMKNNPDISTGELRAMINGYLTPGEQLTATNENMYAATEDAQDFDKRGVSLAPSIAHTARKMESLADDAFRKEGLALSDLNDVRGFSNEGIITEQGLRTWARSKTANPAEAEKMFQNLYGKWKQAAARRGISDPTRIESVIRASRQLPQQNREIAARRKADQILGSTGTTGGWQGLAAGLLKQDSDAKNIWESFLGNRTITPKIVDEIHGSKIGAKVKADILATQPKKNKTLLSSIVGKLTQS